MGIVKITQSSGINTIYYSSPDKFNYGARSRLYSWYKSGYFDPYGNAYFTGVFSAGLFVFSDAGTQYCGNTDLNTAFVDQTALYTNVLFSLPYTNFNSALM